MKLHVFLLQVVPARGQSSFTVTFDPSLVGDSVASQSAYCLGYISLDGQVGLFTDPRWNKTSLYMNMQACMRCSMILMGLFNRSVLYTNSLFSFPTHATCHCETSNFD